MRQVVSMVTMSAVVLSMTGCARMTTRIVEKPRVDQEIRGNRGYLTGSAPAAGRRKTTRKMIQTDIELPTGEELNPWRKPQKPAQLAQAAPAPTPAPISQSWQEPEETNISPIQESIERPAPEAPSATYTVQKGDTLEKISKRFYGSTKKWRRIYNANRGVLKSPDRIRPGQKLTIPSADQGSTAGRPAGGEEWK